ncbi:MAG: class I SAM-dependent methyltransferase [Mycobacterium sp.]|nr:class I SAM-dependent methyltransferase [Mycobacterium sp.]
MTCPAPVGASETEQAGNVYQPQHDSKLLVDAMARSALIPGRRVLDLCTGSGFVAIAAAEMGCAGVTAFDICPHAVRSSRGNAAGAGVTIDVRQGPWSGALDCAPFDVVVANPPYVPTPPADAAIPAVAGPWWAWDAGADGRAVLDPLCRTAPKLLCHGGTILLVQSELADAGRSVEMLRAAGVEAAIVASRRIPFGPVLSARARWLESTGRIPPGCRDEELVVIRGERL